MIRFARLPASRSWHAFGSATFERVHSATSATRRCYVQEATPCDNTVHQAERVPRSAYVHLPFCKRRCHYCDFPVHVLGSRATAATDKTVSDYVALLCQEIQNTASAKERPLETVFFGGGTPSLISPHELEIIVHTLQQRFGLEEDVEMSMEADPGTFDRDKLSQFLSLGVNRISLGVQAFDDVTLQLCGRSHTLEDVWQAIRDIQSTDVPSWSLDLISSLPHASLESWQRSLEMAVECRPDHISVYDLQIEEGTLFGRRYQPEMSPLPSHDLSAEMYILASDLLRKAGYEHYEISNYARDGHRCRHNMTYWTHRPYYGFGMGAASYTAGQRISRPGKIKPYAEWVQSMHATDTSPSSVEEKECVLEDVMLRLRLRDGIALDAFRDMYGKEAEKNLLSVLRDYFNKGLIECIDRESRLMVEWKGEEGEAFRMRLKDPEGFLLSNEILSSVFHVFE